MRVKTDPKCTVESKYHLRSNKSLRDQGRIVLPDHPVYTCTLENVGLTIKVSRISPDLTGELRSASKSEEGEKGREQKEKEEEVEVRERVLRARASKRIGALRITREMRKAEERRRLPLRPSRNPVAKSRKRAVSV